MNSNYILNKFNLKWLLLVLAISVTWVNLNHERYLSKNIIDQDVINYYSYLPALLIEHDLTLSFLNKPGRIIPDGERYWPNKTPDGKPVIKMSMGMALSYLPFFLIAHAVATIFDFPATGFSEPYQFAVLFSSLFYIIIGFLFLWKILRKYFNSKISLVTIFLLSFGTNIFYSLTLGGGLAHTVGFTLTAAFLYYTILWRETNTLKYTLILGLILGLLILVRPINGLLFVLFTAFNFDVFIQRESKQNSLTIKILQLVLMGLIAGIVLLPQLLYWKMITGNFVFNSYVGEHFYFANPHIINGLFSFRKGWLIYTPIMGFSLLGIFLLKNDLKIFRLPVVILFIVYIYVCYSWWCWWYGGSFAQRALIDIYPVLSLPFAAFISLMLNQKVFVKGVFITLVSFFVFLNLFQTMQAKYNIIHFDSMTRTNYFEVFFTTSKKPDREKYLKHPNYDKALKGEDEY